MMEIDQTDNQQLNQILGFIKENLRLIVLVLVFCAIILVGARYWKQNKQNFANNASQIFQEMMVAEFQQDTQSASAKSEQLMTEFTDSPYAQLAGLWSAKIAVDADKLDDAAGKLHWVLDHSNANDIATHIATVRLAAILQQQGKMDEALALVSKDPAKAYLALYAQARGDIYVAQGNLEQAKKEYMLALQSLPNGAQSPILQMKLLDLGGEEHA